MFNSLLLRKMGLDLCSKQGRAVSHMLVVRLVSLFDKKASILEFLHFKMGLLTSKMSLTTGNCTLLQKVTTHYGNYIAC